MALTELPLTPFETFTRDDDALPPPYVAWNRDTVVFKGALPDFCFVVSFADPFWLLPPFAVEREMPAGPLLVSAAKSAFVERPDSDLGSLSTRVSGTGVGAGDKNATFFCALSVAALESAVLRLAREGVIEAPSIESWRARSVRVTVREVEPTRSSCEGARELVLASEGDGRGVREEDARDSVLACEFECESCSGTSSTVSPQGVDLAGLHRLLDVPAAASSA